MNKQASTNDGLDDNLRDKLVAVGKAAASLVPMAGGPLAEIVGAVVPGQRADRIAAYLRLLAARIDELEAGAKTQLASDREKINLIEEGGMQAARALSPDRIEQIVHAVSRGITQDEAELVRRKRLLILLGELDDDEVNLLNAYGRSYGGRDRNAFADVNRPDPPHMRSSRDDMDRNRLFDLGKEHLLRLDLLKKNYGNVGRGEMPEFDARKGDFKHSVEISYLGRMLLREIGMATTFDTDHDQGGT